MAKGKGSFNQTTPALAVLLVSTLVLYFVNEDKNQKIQDDLDVFKSDFDTYKSADALEQQAKSKAADTASKANAKFASGLQKDFIAFQDKTGRDFSAAYESIKTTNVEIEQVKQVLSGLDNRVSDSVSTINGQIAGINSEIYGTNDRVAANAAAAAGLRTEMQNGFGGLEAFYEDIKGQTEWAVQGPGGCNDGFNGEAKHPWKLTRSFVHSRQKIELEQCKLLCKSSDWGCKYISFYGAGKGWCYGFQSCDSHTTGQGWGGYTTYSRRTLKDKFTEYVE